MSENTRLPDANHTEPQRRPWILFLLSGLVVVAAVVAAVVLLQQSASPPEATEDEPLNFADVLVTDLVQEKTFDGTLGSIEDEPVATQIGGTVTQIAATGKVVGQGGTLFAIDNQPVVLLHGDLPAFRDITIGEDLHTVQSLLSGTVTWVAQPGTVIEQGDVLFRVDDNPVVALYGDLPAYRGIGVAAPNLDVVAAQASLSGAQANLTALTSPPSEQEVQAARQGLNAAQQALQDLLGLPDPEAVQIARANLKLAETSVQAAQSAYDQVAHLADVGTTAEAAALQQATTNYELAQAQYDQAVQGASPAEIASVQAQIAQARATLDALQQGPDPDALSATEAQVEQAQTALDLLLSEALSGGQASAADLTGAQTVTGNDVRQLKAALVALGYSEGTPVAGDEFTIATQEMVKAWQTGTGAVVDGVVNLGEVIFLPGPAQVLDVLAPPGSQAGSILSVATGDPATGTDVLQLEEALVALGFDAGGELIADGFYAPETSDAVLALQATSGLEHDGIIDLGEIIFLPGPVRITSHLTGKGTGVDAGTAILGISLADKVVRIDLPADKQGILDFGDAVTVEMPDGSLIPASVVFISQTATPAADGPATFEVRIELDDPTAAAELDEAPVDVIVTSDSVQDVMAIPVSALLALLEGGYAVEVDTGEGRTQLVAVEVGFFGSNNMIEITSGKLEPGDRVVVP